MDIRSKRNKTARKSQGRKPERKEIRVRKAASLPKDPSPPPDEKYKSVFESAPIGIYRMSPGGRLLMANPAIIRMLGYSSFEDLAALDAENNPLFHPDTPRRVFFEKIEREGEVVGLETKWLRRDGLALIGRENARAIRDELGQTLCYEGTIEDIGRQKQSQEELRYRVGFERLIVSISTRFVNVEAGAVDSAIEAALEEMGEFEGVDRCHIYQFSKDGKRVSRAHGWNSPVEGAMSAERAGQTVTVHPWTLKKIWTGEVVQLSRKARPTQRRISAEAEYEYMERKGMRSMLCVPFRMRKHERGFLLLASEIEERVWSPDTISLLRVICEILGAALEIEFASAALGRERKFFATLMDNIPDYIYFKDMESRFIRANKTLVAASGAGTAEGLLGKTDFDIFPSEQASQAFEDEQRVIKTGKPILDKEEKMTWPDGREAWYSTTKMPLHNDEGQIVGTFGISRDITARKRMEDERRDLETRIQHTQKLESLSVLSGTIAHDFNNLVMGILGHSALALAEVRRESSVWENIKQIEAAAQCAADIANQMLTYSGKTKISLQQLSLSSLVREMSQLLAISISKKARLSYAFADNSAMIEGDSAQLRQIVMNLIINASDAIGEKMGSIVVNTGVQKYDSSYFSRCNIGENLPGGEYVYVEVSDTGCGMDEETLRRIFEPFFTTKSSGRGLGLAAVVGIVRSHNGALKVESAIGKGTTFRMLLPALEAHGPAAESGPKERLKWDRGGVALVVDDDEIVRKVCERILARLGFVTVSSASPDAAVELARQKGADLTAVLLDATLPGVACPDALRMLRQAVGKIPIIIMSGFSLETVAAGVAPDSFEGFLQKPFDGEALAEKLGSLLAKPGA